ncbi:MAG: hypothetical protein M1820_010847 [Bogoriella megaspora]|nr:MAG: hypothetical protein M1820_010847 [Bogoriella megaspora]
MTADGADWPPAIGLTTNIVPRESVILPTHASIRILAPAITTWQILTDTANYSDWCSFCPKVTVHSQPPSGPTDSVLRRGTHFTFHVVMDSKKPTSYTDTQLRVTDVSTPSDPSTYILQSTLDLEPTFHPDLNNLYRISWTTEGGFVSKGLKSERFHEIIIIAEDECEVRTWECQGGSLARVVKWVYKETLQKKFAEWCEDLKRASEAKHNNQDSGKSLAHSN